MLTQRKNPNRIEKTNALLQQLVGQIIQPYLEDHSTIVTVSKVESSRDLRWAKIWISIIGGNDQQILNHLQKRLYEIQGQLNRTLKIKIVPRLQLFLDTSPRHAEHIDELIKKIHEDK